MASLLLVMLVIVIGTCWLVGPAVRCKLPGQAIPGEGWAARTLLSGGRQRCYYLYTPPGYRTDQPLPVVFSLHGFLSNPESQALISGWHKLAAQEGFVVVYPEGQRFPHRWNAGATWGVPNVDDVQFFRDMLADLSTVVAVDRSRVYVNGFSNGGGMTIRLGCEAADQIAALGTVAAAVVSLEDCHPARPVPLIAFHGTADPLVNYKGGPMRRRVFRQAAEATEAPYAFLAVEEWVATWARSNGCSPQPEMLPAAGDVSGVRYVGCDGEATVILYTIADGGHTWPGGWPIPGLGKTSKDISATAEMWSFFQDHPLAGQP